MASSVNSNLSVAAMAGFPTTRPIMGAPLTITNDVGGSYTFQPQAGMMAGNVAESLEKEISKLGCQIILTSARDEASVKRVKKDLEKLNIKIHSIIFNCFHAKRIIINDFAQTNPYPSCEAVNIARNSSIDFL